MSECVDGQRSFGTILIYDVWVCRISEKMLLTFLRKVWISLSYEVDDANQSYYTISYSEAGQMKQHKFTLDFDALGQIGGHGHPGYDYLVGALAGKLAEPIVANYIQQISEHGKL